MGFWNWLKKSILPWLYDAKISKQSLIKLIESLDTDKNGYISVKEVIGYIRNYWKNKR